MERKEEMSIAFIFGEKNIEYASSYNDYLCMYIAEWLDLEEKFFEYGDEENTNDYINDQKNNGFDCLNMSSSSDVLLLSGKKENLEIFKFIVKNNFNKDLYYLK